MSVSSYVSNNGSTITWDGTTKKFKATDAAEYTVTFHMDSINHIWLTDAGTESATVLGSNLQLIVWPPLHQ